MKRRVGRIEPINRRRITNSNEKKFIYTYNNEWNMKSFGSKLSKYQKIRSRNESCWLYRLISLITMKITKLDDNSEAIINELKEIIVQNNYLSDSL